MTNQQPSDAPDFFESSPIDPVITASGGTARSGPGRPPSPVPKKKAGFYLSKDILDRFDRTFYTLKLAGHTIENKSALLEAALVFALDDVDRKDASEILGRLASG
ncbi:MAG: hypothetical protein ABIL58_23825 [Pseudomonadota bacterium]